jgi:hypothetical protein
MADNPHFLEKEIHSTFNSGELANDFDRKIRALTDDFPTDSSQNKSSITRCYRELNNQLSRFGLNNYIKGAINAGLSPTDLEDVFSIYRSGLYSQAKAAYSLRDLFGTNPRCVKVRKGTYDPNNPPSNPEDYEKDFRVSELTDGTLETWVGAGNNGYIETWYDQVGSVQDDPENITGFLMKGVTNPTTLNGEWYKEGGHQGKPIWKHEVNTSLRIIWNNGQWLMRIAGGTIYFRSSVDTAYPFHKDNDWVAESGYTGTPTFHSFDGGWYDPTAGEGGMLTQDSESFQPLIVSNGTYLGEIDFSDEYADPTSEYETSELNRDRLNSHFKFNLQPWNEQYLSIFTVAAFDKDAGELVDGNHKNQVFLVNQAPVEAGDAFQRMVFDNAGNYKFTLDDGPDDVFIGSGPGDYGDNSYHLFSTIIYDARSYGGPRARGENYVDGGDYKNLKNVTSVNSTVGEDTLYSAPSNPFLGKVKELIIFENDQYINRSAIMADINSYHKIY